MMSLHSKVTTPVTPQDNQLTGDFALKLMNSLVKMMSFAFRMMDFVLKTLIFVLKMMRFCIENQAPTGTAGSSGFERP